MGGTSMDAHQMRLEKFKAEQAGRVWKKPTGPKAKKIRNDYAYLVYWYEELRRANPRHMRVEPVPFSEIAAFADLHDLALQSFEVDVLRNLDVVWLNSLPKEKEPPRRPGRG